MEVEAEMKSRLSPKRFAHVRGVAGTAAALARRFGLHEDVLVRAAWVHDAFREASKEELLTQAAKYQVPKSAFESRWPIALHGPVAARWAEAQGLLEDPEGVDAVYYHMTGKAHFPPLGQALFIADKTEPGRTYPGVEALRAAAREGLEAGFKAALGIQAAYAARRREVHPCLEEAYRYYIGGTLFVGKEQGRRGRSDP